MDEKIQRLLSQDGVPAPVRTVMARLDAAGHEAYLVGGCVRDLLLGNTPHDWDVCTDAEPDRMRLAFAGLRVLETGARHGTLTVLLQGQPVEVTTYRVDGEYSDHRHPDGVTFTRSLREDLARRDFTVNAMAFRPDTGLVDLFGGREDLRAGRIRCVGNPRARFDEDALRILRALRFASRYGFAIEEETTQALLALRGELRHVASERVLSELCGMDFARISPRFLPVLQAVIPELEGLDVPDGLPPEPAVRLAALLRGLDAQAILTRLKASRALAERAGVLARALDEPRAGDTVSVRRLLRRVGVEAAQQLFAMQQNAPAMAALDAILDRGDCYALRMLAVGGNDLQALGFSGRAIGRMLEALLDGVVDGALPNEKQALLDAARGMGEVQI